MTNDVLVGGSQEPLTSPSRNVLGYLLRLLGLAVVDALAIWLLYVLLRDGVWPLAIPIAVITLLVNFFNLHPRLAAMRWQLPAIAIIILIVVFPIVFTIYSSFTNYSSGHILSKQQVINQLEDRLYLPEGGPTFAWAAYRNDAGEFGLWLTNEAGEEFWALPDEPIAEAESVEEVGAVDEDGFPTAVGEYRRLTGGDLFRSLEQLNGVQFGQEDEAVQIRNTRQAASLRPRYEYDNERDAIIDHVEGGTYVADENRGFFINEEGENLFPGYQVTVGTYNYERLFTSPAFRGPFIRIFLWTIAFALLSVLTTFALGLLLAMAFNDPILPGRKLIRSLLIIPYTLPGIIGVLIWRGMLNPFVGVLATTIGNLVGWFPPFLTHPFWVKVGILLVNLWLGYPYMMLISSGALQSVPDDVYDAAAVDGANAWQRFWNITLPILLVSVGPLLIASFVFNFNNFTVIFGYNEGRPPIAGSPTPAGHSDILISYTYRIAFEGGRGSDYAYAAAVTVVIFAIVAILTLIQFRVTRQWEEVSESV